MSKFRKLTPHKWPPRGGRKTHDNEQAKQALAEMEERYRSLVDLSPEAIVVHSEGKLVYLNLAAARQIGLENPEQAIGLSIMDLLPPESRQLNLEIMEQVTAGNKSLPPLEQTIIRPDGKLVDVEIIGAPVLFQGKPALQLIIRNISEQRQTRQAIRESERHLRSLIEAAPLGLHQYELFPDGQLIFTGANPAANRILGFDHLSLLGLQIEDAFPAHRQSEIPAIYARVAIEGTPYFAEQISYQDEHVAGVFEVHAFQTGPSRMAVFFQDITEKRKSEVALHESEEKFRTLIEQNSEGVVLTDEQGLVIEWNAAQERTSGVPRSEALGCPIWEVQYRVMLPERKNPALLEAMKEKTLLMLQTGQASSFYQPVEVTIQGPNKRRVTIQQTGFPIKTNKGYRIGSVMRDITERKLAEQDLQRRLVELEALHAVALAGTEAASTDDLLKTIVGIIREKLYAANFGVFFLNKNSQTLIVHPSFTKDACKVNGQIPINKGIIGWVARSGKPRRVADVHLDPYYLNGDPDIYSELCVPLKINGQFIGVINLENTEMGSFTEADERLVTAIASELGTALEKIRLLEAEQNRRRELEAIEQVSGVLRAEVDKDKVLDAILERVMAVMNLKGAEIVLLDPNSGKQILDVGKGEWLYAKKLPSLRAKGVIGKHVAETQHYYLNNDLRADRKAAIAEF